MYMGHSADTLQNLFSDCHLDNAERTRLSHQFQNRHRSLTIASVLLLLLAVISLIAVFLFTAAGTPFLCCLACAISAAGTGVAGIWALLISGRHETDFSGARIIVYESRLGLILGGLLYAAGLVLTFVTANMAACREGSSIIVSVISVLLFLGWAACVCDYRNRRILMNESRVWGATAFGRNWTFSKSKIHETGLQISAGGFIAKDASGRTLFRFENNMIHAKELFHALEGTLPEALTKDWDEQDLEDWKKAREEQWDPSQETEQNQQAGKIRRGYRILVFINLALFIFLFFFCPVSLIKGKYQFLLIQLLPVTYFIYGWIFNHVMTWMPLSDMNASAEWKEKHAGMGFVFIHLGILLFLVTEMTLSPLLNYLAGGWIVYTGALLLTVVFLIITIRRTRGMPHRILTPVTAAFLFLIYSIGVMPALTLATAHSSKINHYPAEVVRLWEDEDSKYVDRYYSELLLPDGTKTEVRLFHSVYEDLLAGEDKTVCDQTGLFGIRFISVHDPS